MILITGGSGLVGYSLRKIFENEDVRFLNSKDCDLRDARMVDFLFMIMKPVKVIHLAARVGGVYANLDNNLEFLLDNSKINNNIVEMCKKYKVKLLINILSTCIFPNDIIKYPITSDQLHNGLPHHSNIGYAYSKRLLQVSSKILSETTDTKVINLTPTNLYGENDNYNLINSHVIPALIHKVYNAKKDNKTVTIKGDGKAVRQFVYAGDLAKIIYNLMNIEDNEKYKEMIVASSSEYEISIKDVLDIIIKEFEYTGSIEYDTMYSNGQYRKTVDSSELNKFLPGFQFTKLENGLKNTIKYFCDNYTEIRK